MDNGDAIARLEMLVVECTFATVEDDTPVDKGVAEGEHIRVVAPAHLFGVQQQRKAWQVESILQRSRHIVWCAVVVRLLFACWAVVDRPLRAVDGRQIDFVQVMASVLVIALLLDASQVAVVGE